MGNHFSLTLPRKIKTIACCVQSSYNNIFSIHISPSCYSPVSVCLESSYKVNSFECADNKKELGIKSERKVFVFPIWTELSKSHHNGSRTKSSTVSVFGTSSFSAVVPYLVSSSWFVVAFVFAYHGQSRRLRRISNDERSRRSSRRN